LLEREFYRLADLARRWGCEVDDLLHLGIRRQAQVCVLLPRGPDGWSAWSGYGRDGSASPDDGVPWSARNLPDGLAQAAPWLLRHLEGPHAFIAEVDTLTVYRAPADTGQELGGWLDIEFDPSLTITTGALCMTHSEVERVGREYFSRSESTSAPEAGELSEREKVTLLNTIAVLLELVKTPRPGRDSNSDVIQEMLANYNDKQGISKRTLEKTFAAAVRSLKN